MGILNRDIKQSILPNYLELKTVNDLTEVDGWKYVTPWSISVDETGKMWISKGSAFNDYEAGTNHTKIKVTNLGIVKVKENTIQEHRFRKARLSVPQKYYLPVCLV